MAGVFAKLNLKGQAEILVLNAPESFEPEIATLTGVSVRRRMPKGGPVEFALVFAVEQADVDSAAAALARLTQGDAIVWFAYPKGTSSGTGAASTATPAGGCSARTGSSPCVRWRSTRIGRPCASAGPSSSGR